MAAFQEDLPTSEINGLSDPEVDPSLGSNPLLPEEQWGDFLEFSDSEDIDLPRGADIVELPDGTTTSAPKITGNQSIFNDFHLFRFKDNKNRNYPLTEEQQSKTQDLYTKTKLSDLVSTPRGASIYKPADFLYCADAGLPINKLVTLRRFPYPCFDNIFDSTFQTEPDLARMITYMSEDRNKLSDIATFSYNLNWKSLTADMEQASMLGDDQSGVNGYMKSILSYVDPKFGQEAMQGSTALEYDPKHDQNKVYGPVDSISKTTIRDVGLDFKLDMSLEFNYKLRSINGINGKTAFIDLISNILACTYNNGKFWGGARYWTGPRPTKYMDNLKFLSSKSFDDFLVGGTKQLKGLLSSFKGPKAGNNAVEMLKTIAFNAINLNFGKILDQVGRPGIVIVNSLLTGNPVGEWHVTVGNPLNPIITIGNMILKSTTLTFGDELGYDDFPTELKVTVELEPAMPKDKAGIESMFTRGQGRTYWKPTKDAAAIRSGKRKAKSDKGLVYNELISRPLDALFTGSYNSGAAAANVRKSLNNIIYDFTKNDSKPAPKPKPQITVGQLEQTQFGSRTIDKTLSDTGK